MQYFLMYGYLEMNKFPFHLSSDVFLIYLIVLYFKRLFYKKGPKEQPQDVFFLCVLFLPYPEAMTIRAN